MEKHIHLHLYTGGGAKAPPAKDAVVATPVAAKPLNKAVVPKVQPVQPMASQPQEHDCSCGGKPRMPVSR